MKRFVRRCRRPPETASRIGAGQCPAFFLRQNMRSIAKELRARLVATLFAFAVGAVLSLALFAYVQDDLRRDGELRFEREAADAKHIIERRLQSYVGVTAGLSALFAARDRIGRAEF